MKTEKKKGLFIQNSTSMFLGSMHISAALKKAGHDCDLLITGKEKNLLRKIKQINPDYILITLSSMDVAPMLKVLSKVKKNFNIPVIAGGIHPTIAPQILKDPRIDVICKGEGENAIVELFNGKELSEIKNLVYKKDGEIFTNQLACFQDFDELPFADRELYRSYPLVKNDGFFMGIRGCPFQCSYCFNIQLQKKFSEQGGYIRTRNPESLIKEIEQAMKKIRYEKLVFQDSTFNLNKEWLRKFSKLYKERINLPYTCSIRLDFVDEECAQLLAESNCQSVLVGVETGNETLRKTVLNKPINNQMMLKGANLLHKYKIHFQSNNMLGIPDETIENSFETIKLNIKLKPDVVWCSMMVPYSGTGVYDYAVEKGYLKKDVDTFKYSIFENSPLKMKDIKKINNLHKFFYLSIKYPSLIPIVKVLIKLPPNKLFHLFFYIGHGIRYYYLYKPSPLQFIKRGFNYITYNLIHKDKVIG